MPVLRTQQQSVTTLSIQMYITSDACVEDPTTKRHDTKHTNVHNIRCLCNRLAKTLTDYKHAKFTQPQRPVRTRVHEEGGGGGGGGAGSGRTQSLRILLASTCCGLILTA